MYIYNHPVWRYIFLPTMTLLVFLINNAMADCTQYCHPDRSKPCGNACISKYKVCTKSWTTACSGERPATAKKVYENPTKVEPGQEPTAKGN